MKRWVYSSTDLSKEDKLNLRHVMHSIISYLWNNKDASDFHLGLSTKEKTLKDYQNSDYTSLSEYVMDHKQDIFPRGDIMMEIDEASRDYKNSYAVRQELLKIFDNYTERDFARGLYLHKDDPKRSTYVSSSNSILSLQNPAFKYFIIYEDDESFMRELGLTDLDIEGFRIGDSPEGYDDYPIVAHAIAKQKYIDVLSDIGYDILDIYEDEPAGPFLGIVIGGRLHDVDEEVLRAVRDRRYVKSSYVSGESLENWCKTLPAKIHTLYLHYVTGEIIGKMSVRKAVDTYGEAKVTSSYSDGDGQMSVWILE